MTNRLAPNWAQISGKQIFFKHPFGVGNTNKEAQGGT